LTAECIWFVNGLEVLWTALSENRVNC